MEKYINVQKIISLCIVEPAKNCGESWDVTQSHDWLLQITLDANIEGFPVIETIERKTLKEITDIFEVINNKINLVSI